MNLTGTTITIVEHIEGACHLLHEIFPEDSILLNNVRDFLQRRVERLERCFAACENVDLRTVADIAR